MNNQNIQNLVEFIRKNSSFPQSQLEESSLKAGYSKEEFGQALEIIAKTQSAEPSSQNIIPINQEVLTPEQNKQSSKTLLFVFLGIFVFLILIGIAVFYFLKQNKPSVEVTTQTPSPSSATFKNLVKSTSEPSKQPSEAVLENNSMKTFSSALSSADYKVITSGKIENKKQEGGGTQTSSLDLNNGIVYIRKGSVVRIDKTDPQKPEIVFMKEGKIYALNPEKKRTQF